MRSSVGVGMPPPNESGGGGSWRPSIVYVALVEPGVPVVCWATTGRAPTKLRATQASNVRVDRPTLMATSLLHCELDLMRVVAALLLQLKAMRCHSEQL